MLTIETNPNYYYPIRDTRGIPDTRYYVSSEKLNNTITFKTFYCTREIYNGKSRSEAIARAINHNTDSKH
jgi:hypothetical protein